MSRWRWTWRGGGLPGDAIFCTADAAAAQDWDHSVGGLQALADRLGC